MKRNELTTVAQLREGDRFYRASDKKLVTYHLIEQKGSKGRIVKAEYAGNADFIRRGSFEVKGHLSVRFLRHTNPLPGEDCYVGDLQEGDVFKKHDNKVIEFEVIKKGVQFFEIYDRLCDQKSMAGVLAPVILIRKKEAI